VGYLYILGTVVFTVYGQLIMKWRIVQFGALPDGFLDKLLFLIKLVFDPYIFTGFVAAFVAALFWMAAMTKFDISFAYPLITAGLTLTTVIMAILLLHEPITINKTLGVMLIMSGVIIMVRDV